MYRPPRAIGLGVGAYPIFGSVNRALVQRTAGLLELARKEEEGGRGRSCGYIACYGPAFTYSEFTPRDGVVSALLFSIGLALAVAALAFIVPVRVNLFFPPSPSRGLHDADHTSLFFFFW